MTTTHSRFTTTSSQGLRHDILPMRLYHKAKKLGMVKELFEGYEEIEEMPFGLNIEEYLNYAMMQFGKRYQRIQRAQEETVEQLYQSPETEFAEE